MWHLAEYSTFSISDEVGKYRLTVAGYSGDAGDAMSEAYYSTWNANGQKFSTPDSDNDGCTSCSCAIDRSHGWWFNRCTTSSLNYVDGGSIWTTDTSVYDVQASRMLVKL